MLEREFKYYVDNQDTLVKKYNGKHLIIIGDEVKGAFDTNQGAYEFATKNYTLGEFLIQHCKPGKDSYTQTFHSRVIINKNPVLR